MSQAPTQGWKYYLGLALFLYSFAALGIAALAPFLFSAAVAATVATGVVVSGEVGFLISAALLGKPFVEGLKAKVKSFFVRPAGATPEPISRSRHVFGLVLFSLSFVTYYVAMAIPFFGLDKTIELTAIVIVAISGEVLFLTSLFVLGGEFWGRIKALFQWPAQSEVPPLPSAGSPALPVP
jgi:hypothetical protein